MGGSVIQMAVCCGGSAIQMAVCCGGQCNTDGSVLWAAV